jgi:PAS domain S-box-containing protein
MTEIALPTTSPDLQTSLSDVSHHREFLQHLWEGVSYGIFVLDVLDEGKEFRYAAFNPAMSHTSQIPVDQLLGKTITEALPGEMATLYHDRYSKCLRSQQSISFEEHFCYNNQETWWLLTVNPLCNNKQIEQLLVTAIDISDRKVAEAQHQHVEKMLQLTQYAFDYAGNAMYWIQSDARFSHANQRACQMLGYTLDELLSMSVFDVDADFPPDAWPEHWQQLKQQGSLTFESSHRAKNGRSYPVEILISYLELDGKEYNFAQVKDISDRQQQENALRFIVEGTVSKTGNEFFRACVQHLAEIFHIQYAFITELADETFSQSRMLSLWTGEGFVEPYEFDLAGTPCSVVFQENWGIFPDALQARFPDADLLATLGAQSYLGVVIIDSQGRAIGNLGIIDTKPLPDNLNTIKSILQLFAARVGAEMERNAASMKLQEQEQFLRTVYEGASQPIFVIDVLPDGEFHYVGWNASAEAASGMCSQDISGKTPEEIYGMEAGKLDRQRLQECLASEKSISYEECLMFNGKESWWVTTQNPIKDSNGKIYRFIGTTFDISDRQQAEKALQESNTLLNSVLETMPDLFFAKDLQGRHIALNSNLAQFFNKSVVDVLGQTDADLLPPEAAREIMAKDREIIRTGITERFEEIVRTAGVDATYLTIKTPLRDVRGNIIGLIGVAQNITDRKTAEAQLLENELFLRTIYEGVSQGICVLDVTPANDFCFIGWNPLVEQLIGILSADIVGKNPEEVLGAEYGAKVRQNYQRCLATGTTISYEELIPFQGKNIWWLTTLNPLRDESDRIYRIIITTMDISDRKIAEAALSEYADRQTLLNQLVNHIRNSLDLDAVIGTTIQSIRNLLDIDACAFAWYSPNADLPTWEVIKEAKLEDIPTSLGCYPSTFVGPVDQLLFKEGIFRVDDVEQYEEPIHREFLKTINCQSEILLPIHTHSNRIGIIICVHHRQVRPWRDSEVELLKAVSNQLAIAIDQAELYAESHAKSQELQKTLQELQRTQTQMVQAEKMSSLGQLVAGIAHEINNPVNFIHGNIDHAEEYTQDLLDLITLYQAESPQPSDAIATKLEAIDLDFLRQDLRKLLTSMQIGTERIREIVKSLRLFSRLDESEVKPVNIHDGIDSTLTILQHRLKAQTVRVAGTEYHRAEIQIIKEYGNLPEVECFAGQLNQVFMNILANAIDALEERDRTRSLTDQNQDPSTIRIITEITENNHVSIHIIDNGLGIPSQIQEKIFDPFFTTKPIGKGTGMGMSISYQIVIEKHRGQLFCHSTPGQGTEFVIQIPIQQYSRDK